MTRVLVVDDEVQVAHALRRLLRRAGLEVRIAGSGAEALTLLEGFEADLVLSDFRMPGMNGAELLAEVKHRHPLTLRVILSGYADLTSIMASVNDGEICRFIHKPWDDEKLVALVRQLLDQRQVTTALYRTLDEAPGVAEILHKESCIQLRLESPPGAAFSAARATELIARMIGTLSEEHLQVVTGLLARDGARIALVAEIGGTETLTLELPLPESHLEAAP